MVFKYKVGNIEVHHPPYTQVEEAEFYAAGPPKTVAAGKNVAKPVSAPKKDHPPG